MDKYFVVYLILLSRDYSTQEAFHILIQGDYVEPAVLYAYRTAFLKEHKLLFQEGKSECDFSFVPLA